MKLMENPKTEHYYQVCQKATILKITATRMFEQSNELVVFTLEDVARDKLIHQLKLMESKQVKALANVVHDLRAPLSFLKSNNEMIEMSLDRPVRQAVRRFFKRFRDQHAYLCSIIDDILDIAKLEFNHFSLNFE